MLTAFKRAMSIDSSTPLQQSIKKNVTTVGDKYEALVKYLQNKSFKDVEKAVKLVGSNLPLDLKIRAIFEATAPTNVTPPKNPGEFNPEDYLNRHTSQLLTFIKLMTIYETVAFMCTPLYPGARRYDNVDLPILNIGEIQCEIMLTSLKEARKEINEKLEQFNEAKSACEVELICPNIAWHDPRCLENDTSQSKSIEAVYEMIDLAGPGSAKKGENPEATRKIGGGNYSAVKSKTNISSGAGCVKRDNDTKEKNNILKSSDAAEYDIVPNSSSDYDDDFSDESNGYENFVKACPSKIGRARGGSPTFHQLSKVMPIKGDDLPPNENPESLSIKEKIKLYNR